MTGIILRKGIKTYFDITPPVEGEIVFATDTNEIGILSGTEIIWQEWGLVAPNETLSSGYTFPDNSNGLDGDKYVYLEDIGGVITIREFKKATGTWQEIHWGETLEWVVANLEPDRNEFVGQRGDYKMDSNFVPILDNDIATKEYFDGQGLGSGPSEYLKVFGDGIMDSGYVVVDDLDFMTLGSLLQGDLSYMLPTTEPQVPGAIWNNNGVLVFSTYSGALPLTPPPGPPTPPSTLGEGLVSHYLLNDDASDVLGVNNGTATAGVTFNGDSATFTGGSIDTTYRTSEDSNTYTISLWFNRNSSTEGALYAEPDSTSDSYGTLISFLGTGETIYAGHFTNVGGEWSAVAADLTGIINVDWNHLVFTRENGVEHKLYLNKTLLGTVPCINLLNVSTHTGKIGGHPDYTADANLRDFDGDISNFRIYNDVKDQVFVDSLFDEGYIP